MDVRMARPCLWYFAPCSMPSLDWFLAKMGFGQAVVAVIWEVVVILRHYYAEDDMLERWYVVRKV
ncbi:hypothetical protein N7523_011012 [Penicillium sp. IBT 18751x]|nr:hypothetical protein N7523_011012 [Penicillium sp. IBT 18751x]